jgi:hypothetical protein
MRICLVSVIGFVALLAGSGLGRAQEDARAIIAKAVKAHGGEEKLAKLRADRVQVKGKLYLGEMEIPFTGETLVQLPGQFKNVMNMTFMGKNRSIVQVLNGDKGWLSIDGQMKEPDAAALNVMKETLYMDQLVRLTPLLKGQEYQLTPLKETKVQDKPAVGVKVASKGHKDASLYFDKESGLLVKAEYKTVNNQQKEVSQEEFFSDFKEVGGFKRPMKVVAFQGSKKLMEAEITDVKYPDKIADSEFAKP